MKYVKGSIKTEDMIALCKVDVNTAFDVLRSKYETYSMAFHELAKTNNNAKCFVDVEIELHNKAQAIAEYLGGVENEG